MPRDGWFAQSRKVQRMDRAVQRHARRALRCRKGLFRWFADLDHLERLAWSVGLAALFAPRNEERENPDSEDAETRSTFGRLWAVVLFGWTVLMRARAIGAVLQWTRREAHRELPPRGDSEAHHHAV